MGTTCRAAAGPSLRTSRQRRSWARQTACTTTRRCDPHGRVQLHRTSPCTQVRLVSSVSGSSAAVQLKCWRDKNSSEPPPDLAPPPPPMRSATPASEAGPAAPSDPAAPQPPSQRYARDLLAMLHVMWDAHKVVHDVMLADACNTQQQHSCYQDCDCMRLIFLVKLMLPWRTSQCAIVCWPQEQQQHTGAGRQHEGGQGWGGNSVCCGRRFRQPVKVVWWLLFQPEPRRCVCAARRQLRSSQGGQCLPWACRCTGSIHGTGDPSSHLC